jgi:TonB family protein
MNKSQVVFFFAVLAIVIAIARCNSKTTSRLETGTPTPTAGSQLVPTSSPPAPVVASTPSQNAPTPADQNQAAQLRLVADHVGSAVILISIFDSSGKLLRNSTGFFVSDDGRFITNRSAVEGGAHAVVKTKDGQIHDVTGILADTGAIDLAVLKAQPKQRVPFLSLNKTAAAEPGTRVAVIGNPLTRRDPVLTEGTIAAKGSDQSGEFFELSGAIPHEAIGCPTVNENGEMIGVVTQRPQGAAGYIVRASGAVNSVLTQIGPATKVRWQLAGSSPNEPAVSPAEGPSPPRSKTVPLAGARPSGNSRLIYSPAPGYPTAARRSYFPLKGTGRFRITFDSSGGVKDVAVIQSTRSETLDNAAVDALRRWKAQPGQEWTANVPITFQP